MDTADAVYKGALAVREQASALALQSSISQGFTRVNSPFEGWVMQTHAEAGDLAVPGKPLVTVYAPQPLRAVVQVPGSRTQAVRTAVQTQVQMDDAQGQTQWIAPVTRSAVPMADPVSQTTEWRFELPSKEGAAWVPGQQVRVRFLNEKSNASRTLMVPHAAILRRGELTAVYLVSATGFALRAVRLGAQQGANGVEVLAGVVEGDVVALDPIRAGLVNAAPSKTKK